MSEASQNLALARQYLKAIESGASGDEMAQFFSPDVIVEIFPSSFFPKGSRDNLDGIRAAADRGKKVMAKQIYEVTNALATGDQVAMEVLWTGTLLVPFQSIPAGGHMRARFAVFLRFQNGKIISQRNYDCYDPV
ncbi:MAG TPA: nuclear transport factor 2 family protein [Candidatus Methylomirabilis sp.]|nr:nuclear transport factor 2 family protein [Candidatus Methylomirabilis sp.]